MSAILTSVFHSSARASRPALATLELHVPLALNLRYLQMAARVLVALFLVALHASGVGADDDIEAAAAAQNETIVDGRSDRGAVADWSHQQIVPRDQLCLFCHGVISKFQETNAHDSDQFKNASDAAAAAASGKERRLLRNSSLRARCSRRLPTSHAAEKA